MANSSETPNINTQGGTSILGGATAGDDLLGRDKITVNTARVVKIINRDEHEIISKIQEQFAKQSDLSDLTQEVVRLKSEIIGLYRQNREHRRSIREHRKEIREGKRQLSRLTELYDTERRKYIHIFEDTLKLIALHQISNEEMAYAIENNIQSLVFDWVLSINSQLWVLRTDTEALISRYPIYKDKIDTLLNTLERSQNTVVETYEARLEKSDTTRVREDYYPLGYAKTYVAPQPNSENAQIFEASPQTKPNFGLGSPPVSEPTDIELNPPKQTASEPIKDSGESREKLIIPPKLSYAAYSNSASGYHFTMIEIDYNTGTVGLLAKSSLIEVYCVTQQQLILTFQSCLIDIKGDYLSSMLAPLQRAEIFAFYRFNPNLHKPPHANEPVIMSIERKSLD